MRKLIFVVLVAISISNIYAIELWYGFTTEMSEKQVMDRIKEVLSPVDLRKIVDTYIDGPSYDGFGYPEPLTRIGFRSQKPEYKGDLYFYLYNDKLFYIDINWDTKDEVVLSGAMAKYGNPTRAFKYSGYGGTFNVYFWQLRGVDFYVYFNWFIFVDNSVREKWVIDEKRKMAEKQAEEDAKRRAIEDEKRREAAREAESKIHF